MDRISAPPRLCVSLLTYFVLQKEVARRTVEDRSHVYRLYVLIRKNYVAC